MKIKAGILAYLLILFSPAVAYNGALFNQRPLSANPVEEYIVKAEVDKQSITTSENLSYKITISSSERKIPAFTLPKFAGFKIISQVNSSAVSLVKGEIKSNIVYVYVLVPLKAGRLKIEPAKIKIKDKEYFTEAFEIEVRESAEKNQALPEKEEPDLKEGMPESEEPQITL